MYFPFSLCFTTFSLLFSCQPPSLSRCASLFYASYLVPFVSFLISFSLDLPQSFKSCYPAPPLFSFSLCFSVSLPLLFCPFLLYFFLCFSISEYINASFPVLFPLLFAFRCTTVLLRLSSVPLHSNLVFSMLKPLG